MAVQRIEFGRREAASAEGCACGHGGGGCMCGGGATAAVASAAPVSIGAADLGVTGMTCEHCVRAVTAELLAVDGVRAVDVQLVPEGVSRVRVDASGPIPRDALAAAIEEAGYTLADA